MRKFLYSFILVVCVAFTVLIVPTSSQPQGTDVQMESTEAVMPLHDHIPPII